MSAIGELFDSAAFDVARAEARNEPRGAAVCRYRAALLLEAAIIRGEVRRGDAEDAMTRLLQGTPMVDGLVCAALVGDLAGGARQVPLEEETGPLALTAEQYLDAPELAWLKPFKSRLRRAHPLSLPLKAQQPAAAQPAAEEPTVPSVLEAHTSAWGANVGWHPAAARPGS